MKKVVVITLVLAVISLGVTVFAQQGSDRATQGQKSSAAQGQGSIQSQDTSRWVGKEVKGSDGEDIGRIRDIVSDNQGQARFAVLSVKGKHIAIPTEALSPGADGKKLTINMSKDQLKNAPEFTQNNLDAPSYKAQLYSFYGVQPSWSDPSGSPQTTPGGSMGGGMSSPDRPTYGTPGSSGSMGGGNPSTSGPSTGTSEGEPTQGK